MCVSAFLQECPREARYGLVNRTAEDAHTSPQSLLKSFFARHKWSYILSTLSILMAQIVQVQFPNLIGRYTDLLSSGRATVPGTLHYALLLLTVGLFFVILFGIGQFRNGQLGRQFEYEMRDKLFAHWETLSTAYFRKRSIGDLLNHAMNDVQAVREIMSMGLNQITTALCLFGSTLFMTLTTVSLRLTLVSIIPLFAVPVIILLIGPKIRVASRKVQEGLSDMAELTEESLTAIRLIKATANEEIEAQRFQVRVDAILRRQVSMIRLFALFQAVFPFVESVAFSIVLLYGGYLTITHQIRLGGFVAFTLYLGMLVQPLQQIGFVINNWQRASASMLRLNVLLSEAPDIVSPSDPANVESLEGSIRVDLDSYQYADGTVPVLRHIHFNLPEGKTLGIVGRTAAGKTTLVNLFPRIFDPPANSIFIGGYDVKAVSLDVLRDAIAYVPQDGFLFSDTIGENIGFSKAGASRAEIEQAAIDACVYDDVMGFTNGFDTLIGERGVALSGGQKQRTAIARAFLKDAPILILDDSLSAIDMNTEKRIIQRIQEIRRGKTTVIIAHRLSAVRHADWIIVMDAGQVIEQGTHESLLAEQGVYATMFTLQEQGEEAAV